MEYKYTKEIESGVARDYGAPERKVYLFTGEDMLYTKFEENYTEEEIKVLWEMFSDPSAAQYFKHSNSRLSGAYPQAIMRVIKRDLYGRDNVQKILEKLNDLLNSKLEEMPLLINDKSDYVKILANWRLRISK